MVTFIKIIYLIIILLLLFIAVVLHVVTATLMSRDANKCRAVGTRLGHGCTFRHVVAPGS